MKSNREKATLSWVQEYKKHKFKDCYPSQEAFYKRGYIDGANEKDEQFAVEKKEALDKAYEWFQCNAWSFGHNSQGDSNYDWEMAFECFRKAMDEKK